MSWASRNAAFISAAVEKYTADQGVGVVELDAAVISETTAIAEIVTSQVALDITLLTQRIDRDIEGVMAKMLGPRVGRLDTLLSRQDNHGSRPPAGSTGDRRPRAKDSP